MHSIGQTDTFGYEPGVIRERSCGLWALTCGGIWSMKPLVFQIDLGK